MPRKPGRPKKERAGSEETGKIWGVRDVDEETRIWLRMYATSRQIPLGQALTQVVDIARRTLRDDVIESFVDQKLVRERNPGWGNPAQADEETILESVRQALVASNGQPDPELFLELMRRAWNGSARRRRREERQQLDRAAFLPEEPGE